MLIGLNAKRRTLRTNKRLRQFLKGVVVTLALTLSQSKAAIKQPKSRFILRKKKGFAKRGAEAYYSRPGDHLNPLFK